MSKARTLAQRRASRQNLLERKDAYWEGWNEGGDTAESQAAYAKRHQDWLRSLGLGAIADRLAAEDAAKIAQGVQG